MKARSKKTKPLPLEVRRAIAGLQWEAGLLRSTLQHAAALLARATVRPYQRGDVWKLVHVRRIARIFAPKARAKT